MAIGDLNGDGKLDIATANQFSNNISVIFNQTVNGSGSPIFSSATNFNSGNGPRSIAMGDFNKDGKLDLVSGNVNSDNVSIFINQTVNGGALPSFSAAVNFASGNGPISVAIFDFNQDSFLDLAVANEFSDNVSVLLGNGAGSFAAANLFPLALGPQSVSVGDLNSDGAPDLAFAHNSASDAITILFSNP